MDGGSVAFTLVVVNAILLAGYGWSLARHLSRRFPGPRSPGSWMAILVGIYLAECVAFSASMATNILGLALAVVWGLVFRHGFRFLPRRDTIRSSLALSAFTCLPALSFLSVLAPLAWGGWSLVSADDGYRFGIPAFVPWPFCSLLGFFLAVTLSALVLKTAITTAVVVGPRVFSRRQEKGSHLRDRVTNQTSVLEGQNALSGPTGHPSSVRRDS